MVQGPRAIAKDSDLNNLSMDMARDSMQLSHETPVPAEWVDRFGNAPRKGCDILIQALERQGVDTVFAYPGGASMEIHQALTRSGSIQNILCRHEQVRERVHGRG